MTTERYEQWRVRVGSAAYSDGTPTPADITELADTLPAETQLALLTQPPWDLEMEPHLLVHLELFGLLDLEDDRRSLNTRGIRLVREYCRRDIDYSRRLREFEAGIDKAYKSTKRPGADPARILARDRSGAETEILEICDKVGLDRTFAASSAAHKAAAERLQDKGILIIGSASYGPHRGKTLFELTDLGRRVAAIVGAECRYIDEIFDGAKPSALALQQEADDIFMLRLTITAVATMIDRKMAADRAAAIERDAAADDVRDC